MHSHLIIAISLIPSYLHMYENCIVITYASLQILCCNTYRSNELMLINKSRYHFFLQFGQKTLLRHLVVNKINVSSCLPQKIHVPDLDLWSLCVSQSGFSGDAPFVGLYFLRSDLILKGPQEPLHRVPFSKPFIDNPIMRCV